MTSLLLISLCLTATPKEDVSKPLKTVINSVRYGKDLIALKNFAGEEQGKLLTAEYWAKGTDAQKAEFTKLFLELFGKMAFPKIRDSFKNLDTVLYDEPTLEGDKAKIGSTILINHPMKKQELKVTYDLVKGKSGWQVVDAQVKGGNSMLTDIRDDQVQPLLKEGGWDGLLKAMRDKAAELKDVQLK
jgi:phospholipid transport system substrate-binding protein